MLPGFGLAKLSSNVFAEKHDHTNRRKYIGGRPNRNKYRGCKAMASKKPRHIHLNEFMRTWKPRYPNG